jgi:hypothetical protein
MRPQSINFGGWRRGLHDSKERAGSQALASSSGLQNSGPFAFHFKADAVEGDSIGEDSGRRGAGSYGAWACPARSKAVLNFSG